MITGTLQKDIPSLPTLDISRYENIFKLYIVEKGSKDSYYYYNILNKVTIPDNIEQNLLGTISLNKKLPWTTFSYQLYGTIQLWWLILLVNKPKNIFYAEPGKQYKYFLPVNVDAILTNILGQVNR